jgi:hypothetical protein
MPLSDERPGRAGSQELMLDATLPKRFYEKAEVAEVEGGFTVHLDGRPVKTPARNAVLLLPTKHRRPRSSRTSSPFAGKGYRPGENACDPSGQHGRSMGSRRIRRQCFEDILRFRRHGHALLSRRESAGTGCPADRAMGSALIDWAGRPGRTLRTGRRCDAHVEQPREAIAAYRRSSGWNSKTQSRWRRCIP